MSVGSIAQFKQTFFIIGTYADPRISRNNDAHADSLSFLRAKSAYFNLLSGPQFYNGSQDFSIMDKTLDLASKNKFYLLAIDSKLNFLKASFSQNTADSIINHFQQLPEDKKKYLLGYYFGGEFDPKNAAKVKQWTKYFKTKSFGKLAYHYLLPDYGFKSETEYDSYLNTMLSDNDKLSLPDVVSYDYYPFIQGPKGIYLRSSYFDNLKKISQIAKSNDKPFWYYVLTTKHFNYPDPDEFELRFMAFCPLTCGAKGILYFTYETIPEKYGLKYGDAIIDKSGNPTYKYEIVKNINRYIQDIAGPVIMESQYISTINLTSGNSKQDDLKDANDRIINNSLDSSIMCGVFKSKTQEGESYLIIVNKKDSTINNVTINLKGAFKKAVSYPNANGYTGNNIFRSLKLTGGSNNSVIVDSLKPADLVIIKLNR